jgi:hypothetical protein
MGQAEGGEPVRRGAIIAGGVAALVFGALSLMNALLFSPWESVLADVAFTVVLMALAFVAMWWAWTVRGRR